MIRKSVKWLSEKTMFKQEDKTRWRFHPAITLESREGVPRFDRSGGSASRRCCERGDQPKHTNGVGLRCDNCIHIIAERLRMAA